MATLFGLCQNPWRFSLARYNFYVEALIYCHATNKETSV